MPGCSCGFFFRWFCLFSFYFLFWVTYTIGRRLEGVLCANKISRLLFVYRKNGLFWLLLVLSSSVCVCPHLHLYLLPPRRACLLYLVESETHNKHSSSSSKYSQWCVESFLFLFVIVWHLKELIIPITMLSWVVVVVVVVWWYISY